MLSDYWSRRSFLRTIFIAAGAASSWLVPGGRALQQILFKDIPPIVPRRPKRPRRVAVLGAGLAGLSAAHELSNLGHDVTILEARNRPGGRVCTLREGFSDGLTAEAGAQILYTAHRYSVHYCLEFDIPLQPVFPRGEQGTSSTFYVKGRVIRGSDVAANPAVLPFELKPEDVSLLKKAPPVDSLFFLDFSARYYGSDHLNRLAGREVAEWDDLKDLDAIPIGEFLQMQGTSKGMVEIIGRGLDHFYNARSLERISTLYVLLDAAIGLRSGHQFRIIGGNDKFPWAFAERLSSKICYGAPVVRIEHSPQEVHVIYLQGGVPQRLSADYVVCALPLPTLRLVDVNPPFSVRKTRAIREVTYASVHKVFLQCRKRYWEEDQWNGNAWTDLPIGVVQHITAHQRGPRGILSTYSTAPAAQEIGSLSEQQQRDLALSQISLFSPAIRKYVENHRIWFWDNEEWNRGGYAVYETEQMTTYFPEVGKPEGRIHFAGEHTSVWHAYMNGALESGYRCAREIHERSEREA